VDHLFAYGTLMCADIMGEVAGCGPLAREPATLRGYGRRAVRGEPYPALVPEESGRVAGVVYRDVPAAAWARLDRFEGELYARRPVVVELSGGGLLPAAAYVAEAALRERLARCDWDFDEFLRRGKARFRKHYRGFRALPPGSELT